MKRVLAWLGQIVANPKGQPSTARVGFVVFVLMGAFWLTADLFLSVKSLKTSGINEQWVLAFGVYAGACTSGYVGGKIAGRPVLPEKPSAD